MLTALIFDAGHKRYHRVRILLSSNSESRNSKQYPNEQSPKFQTERSVSPSLLIPSSIIVSDFEIRYSSFIYSSRKQLEPRITPISRIPVGEAACPEPVERASFPTIVGRALRLPYPWTLKT
jgi:hypothetical protein